MMCQSVPFGYFSFSSCQRETKTVLNLSYDITTSQILREGTNYMPQIFNTQCFTQILYYWGCDEFYENRINLLYFGSFGKNYRILIKIRFCELLQSNYIFYTERIRWVLNFTIQVEQIILSNKYFLVVLWYFFCFL